MSLPLANRIIALAEGRQLEDLAEMLEKEGAVPLRCPMLSILDAPDEGPVLAWLDRLCAGDFAWIILLTGEGLRRLLACADRHRRRDEVVAAFSRVNTITRGPKPARALKEINLAPTLLAQAPTTEGVIATLRTVDLKGLTVGVQLYSEANPPLLQFLRDAGATPSTVQPYVYAPAADSEAVANLIQKMAVGEVSAIVFTSSPQIDRLFEVADMRGEADILRAGLARTLVAAVGPIVEETLHKRGIAVQVCPGQGFVMKNLVQHLKKAMVG